MADEQVRIDLEARDKASDTIDDVAEAAEALEKLEPEITLTAQDDASKKIDAVRDDAESLSRADTEVVLKARIDDARGQLKMLREDLEQTGEQARRTESQMDDIGRTKGPGLAGNAVADLTGPLGEASSAASDIAGVFDGLGDITGAAASRVGLDAEKMAGAITGIGFAVTAAVTAWSYFRQRQEAARQKQEELTRASQRYFDTLRKGDIEGAARELRDMYADAYDAARRAGVGAADFTRFLTGQTDSLGPLERQLADVNKVMDDFAHTTVEQRNELLPTQRMLETTVGTMRDARRAYADANGELSDQRTELGRISSALTTAAGDSRQFTTAQERQTAAIDQTKSALDRMRGALDMEQALLDFQADFAAAANTTDQTVSDQQADVIRLKQSIIDAGEAVGKSPWQIATELEKVDAGDIYAVKNDVEQWYRMHPIVLASKLDRPGQIFTPPSGGTSPTAFAEAVPTIGTVNLTLPAGWRGDPIRTAHAQRRRAGRLYARIV